MENENMVKLPLGSADFDYIRREGYYYVDKTRMIRQVIDDSARSILFTRPRRFGKTTFMTMLRSFFDIRSDSHSFFESLEVMHDREFADKWMNSCPVVYLTLKDVGGNDFSSALDVLSDRLAELFSSYGFIDDGSLGGDEELFRHILMKTASLGEIRLALSVLIRLISRHYGKMVIVLIDEYDVPLERAAQNGFYDQMLDVIRTLFSTALKDNSFVMKSILTGCLRISKESIFTGLNNLAVYSVTGVKFADAFGFTEREVEKLLIDAGLSEFHDVLKKWYDGYRIGSENLYSPWDVIRYVDTLQADRSCKPENYWANSSGNEIIRRAIDSTCTSVSDEFTTLIEGGCIPVHLDEDLTYAAPVSDKDGIWSLMLETGYLTLADKYEPNGETLVRIPNDEIRHLFISSVNSWFYENIRKDNLSPFFAALWDGDEVTLSSSISDYLFRTISYYDYSESFYHAFLAGILSASSYIVKSNIQSGTGRPDIVLLDPSNRRAAVFELKRASDSSLMEKCADDAVRQIEEMKYGKDMSGYRKVTGYGISFFRKDALVRKTQIL